MVSSKRGLLVPPWRGSYRTSRRRTAQLLSETPHVVTRRTAAMPGVRRTLRDHLIAAS